MAIELKEIYGGSCPSEKIDDQLSGLTWHARHPMAHGSSEHSPSPAPTQQLLFTTLSEPFILLWLTPKLPLPVDTGCPMLTGLGSEGEHPPTGYDWL